eukprot:m.316804 g.316804  ORF g.316804 m.316804 type:complete len:64 (+) comp16429_c0_seq1:91-282(+)
MLLISRGTLVSALRDPSSYFPSLRAEAVTTRQESGGEGADEVAVELGVGGGAGGWAQLLFQHR